MKTLVCMFLLFTAGFAQAQITHNPQGENYQDANERRKRPAREQCLKKAKIFWFHNRAPRTNTPLRDTTGRLVVRGRLSGQRISWDGERIISDQIMSGRVVNNDVVFGRRVPGRQLPPERRTELLWSQRTGVADPDLEYTLGGAMEDIINHVLTNSVLNPNLVKLTTPAAIARTEQVLSMYENCKGLIGQRAGGLPADYFIQRQINRIQTIFAVQGGRRHPLQERVQRIR